MDHTLNLFLGMFRAPGQALSLLGEAAGRSQSAEDSAILGVGESGHGDEADVGTGGPSGYWGLARKTAGKDFASRQAWLLRL